MFVGVHVHVQPSSTLHLNVYVDTFVLYLIPPSSFLSSLPLIPPSLALGWNSLPGRTCWDLFLSAGVTSTLTKKKCCLEP